MAEGMYLVYMDLSRQDRRNQIIKRKRELRMLRDDSNPFSLQESTFKHFYRLPKSMCRHIIESLRTFDDQRTQMSLEVRFLSTLFFYAHGAYQKPVSNSYLTPMSQPSLSRTIKYITILLINHFGNEIKFPQTADEQVLLKTGFYQTFGIKGTIGCIDCTHVAIVSPSGPQKNVYMNRKGYYSINVEAACDHRMKFLSVNAKFPGSCHDSGIWTTSDVRISMMRNQFPNTWLLGDSGYPLEPWIMTPVSNVTNEKEEKYNKLHIKTRNVVERSYGALKSRFRCLLNHRLYYSPEMSANIVYACVILHNMCIQSNIPLVGDVILDGGNSNENDHPVQNNEYFREGNRIRSRYINSFP